MSIAELLLRKILKARSWVSCGPYHGLEVSNHGIKSSAPGLAESVLGPMAGESRSKNDTS